MCQSDSAGLVGMLSVVLLCGCLRPQAEFPSVPIFNNRAQDKLAGKPICTAAGCPQGEAQDVPNETGEASKSWAEAVLVTIVATKVTRPGGRNKNLNRTRKFRIKIDLPPFLRLFFSSYKRLWFSLK